MNEDYSEEDEGDVFINDEDINEEIILDSNDGAPPEEDSESEVGDADEEEEVPPLTQPKATFNKHTDSVYCIATHPTKPEIFATGSGDESACTWSLLSESPTQVLSGHTDSIVCCSFNWDGKLFATGGMDGKCFIWDTETGNQLKALEGSEATSMVWHPKGNVIFVGSSDGTGWMWNASNGNLMNVFSGHGKSITDVTFDHEGKQIITVSEDATCRVWNPKTAQVTHTISGYLYHAEPINCVIAYPNSPLILSGGQDGLSCIVNFQTGKAVSQLKGHSKSVECISAIPSMPWAATGSLDGTIGIYDINTTQRRLVLRCSEANESDTFGIVGLSAKDHRLVSAHLNGSVRVWDVRNAQVLHMYQASHEALLSVSVNQDWSAVICGGDDRTVRAFSLT